MPVNIDDSLWLGWWGDADVIVRVVFVLLVAMSLTSWSLIIFKARQMRRIAARERACTDLILQAPELAAIEVRITPGQPLHALLHAVHATTAHAGFAREPLERQLNQTLRESHLRLESGLTVLATIGNAAPFVGLFGTVWGIMHALHALGGDSTLALHVIAGPVSEALVATAAGIFTAVPAVMGYNLLVRRLRMLGAVTEGNAVRLLNRVVGQHAATAVPLPVIGKVPADLARGGRG